MKTVIFLLVVLMNLQYTYPQVAKNEKRGTLTVVITGLENNKGNVRVGLYNSKENYDGGGKAYKGVKVFIKNKKAAFKFDKVPYGIYAIKVYHDENTNDMIDTNSFGIPTEAYGFSNNANGVYGPADYKDAKFLFNKNKMSIEITVHH